MGKITGLVKVKGRLNQVKVFLDGAYTCTLLAEVVLKEGLRVGRELSAEQMESLSGRDRYQRCLNTALRCLACRPRSEAEIKQRLQRRGFKSDYLEQIMAKLKEQGLVDDAAFARFWMENRESFSPRSRRLTGMELRHKGLDRDIIEKVTGEIDDTASAYRAALERARRLATGDYNDFRRRLGAFLTRRGFNYEVIDETIKKIYRELGDAGQRPPAHKPEAAGIRRAGLRRSSPIRKELTVR